MGKFNKDVVGKFQWGHDDMRIAGQPANYAQPWCYEKCIAQHVRRCKPPGGRYGGLAAPFARLNFKAHEISQTCANIYYNIKKYIYHIYYIILHITVYYIYYMTGHIHIVYMTTEHTTYDGSCPASNAAQSMRLLHSARQKSSGRVKFPLRSSNS